MSPHDSPFCLVQNMVSAPRQPLASGSFYSPSEYMGPLCALRLLPELVRHVSAPLRFASPRTSDRTSTLPLPRPTHRPLLFRRALRGSTPARYGTDLGNVHPPQVHSSEAQVTQDPRSTRQNVPQLRPRYPKRLAARTMYRSCSRTPPVVLVRPRPLTRRRRFYESRS